MADRFGASTQALEALLQTTATQRWLNPTQEVSHLGSAFQRRVSGAVAALQEALQPLAGDETLPPVRVEFADDLAAAVGHWFSAWSTDPLFARGATSNASSLYLRALSTAAAVARRESVARASSAQRADLDDELDARMQEVAARSAVWNESPGICPGQVLTSRQAEWVLAFDDAPSPWSPLLSLWALGAWPLLLPNARLLLYVPPGNNPTAFHTCPRLPLVASGPAPLEYLGVSGSLLPTTLPLAQLTFAEHERFPLGVYTPIGRDHDNVIVFRERTVSRHQAWVVFRDSQFVIVDQRSSGGTSIDGQRLEAPVALSAGQAFTLPSVGQPLVLRLEVLGGLRRGSFGLVHRT